MADPEGTCDYVARKEDPSNWHGDDPDDWLLDNHQHRRGLEQEVWECPHESLDGEEYCAFHTSPEDMPDDVDEGERFVEVVNEVSAVDNEEAARRHKEFVGATFGAFDIENETLDAGDEHPIRLDHATFAHGLNAENAVFEHDVLARQARFETGEEEVIAELGWISFRHAEFREGTVSFWGAEFGEGTVSFADSEFGEGEVSFWGAEFGRGKVSFSDATFGGSNVVFSRAAFGEGRVSFNSAEFGGGRITFNNAEFGEGVVSFVGSEFGEGRVLFDSATFGEGMVLFDTAAFGEGRISFEGATVAAPLSFLNTRFDVASSVVLTDVNFRDDVAFGFGIGAVPAGNADKNVYEHSLDFSGATFRRALEFRGGVDSTTRIEQSDQEEQQFDFVFAGDVDFSDVTFQDGIDFSNTRFPSDAKFTDATLEGADFEHADVTGTENISTASFDGTNLTGANFSRAELAGASFERARLNRAELLWANLAGAKLYGALLGDARINRETDFWLDGDDNRRDPDGSPVPVRVLRRVKMAFRDQEPYCSYDPRYRGSDGSVSLEKAGEVYGTLENLARNNSLPGLASECFLGRKDVQLRKYWRDGETMMTVRSFVPTLVARYGESPARVLGTGAVTVLAFGLVYYAFGLVEHANSGYEATLFESLYFSGLTFTTLGYGDFAPVNQWGQVLAVFETSIGVVLLAILVFVFGRRATR
ncbi:pentapeptide repeat-containing protein [Halorubrum vacuolatum]|uniref:Uncharacterized protein YjbI, contains pentapeptide repeats n=1 Tax=Halorubrum vacuolatum TaxID=63740 RepID=A0A238W953_HALVU|nr:pentapeptide repeat-containing protein [Halorubrum vacuolatum]SNR43106.1 Uncharacterized protein YjbI, contains pentapeptide repeats [Halorubrum vacuolatum]